MPIELLGEAEHAVRLVDREHAEFARALERHLDDAHRDVGLLLDVKADHGAVVHLVDVIPGEHQHVQRTMRADDLHVLPERVRGALVPLRPEALLRRDHLHELAELAAQVAPATLDVLDERVGLVLRQHRDLPDARIHAVREHEIDDPEFAAEGCRGLAAVLGQVLQPLAAATRHDHGQRAPGQAAQVAAWRKLPLLFGAHPVARSRSLR
jgi:hypothetical protein